MSVLVKGIDMPKSCWECMFREFNTQSLDPFTDYCYITGHKIGRYERKKNCPLVSVSDDAVSPCDKCGFIGAVVGEDRAIGGGK